MGFVTCAPVTAQTVVRDIPLGPSATVQFLKPDKTVFPITEVRFGGAGLSADFGTGFCLDPICRFIVTNYHVALITRAKKIRGQKVVHQYLATGPTDEGASMNDGESVSPMKFTLSRDLAVFELRRPLPSYHGIPFSMNEMRIGQRVDIYAYPKEGINPFRSLLKFHAAFRGETATGLLAFDYALSEGKAIRPGASGGIVVDSESQRIAGVLCGIAKIGGAPVALAVPVGTLADFVHEIDPVLAESLFPLYQDSISPTLEDFHSKLAPLARSHFRLAESAEVQKLRTKAKLLADDMHNLVAVQTLEWGSGNSPPSEVGAYEIQVVDGYQRFRRYPDGKTMFTNIPYPSLHPFLVPASEWSGLPEMIGKQLRLRIRQAEDATIDGNPIKVFQYQADVEDSVCAFLYYLDFGIVGTKKAAIVSCYGEVWTDKNLNILRISEHYELTGKWKDYLAVMSYGWFKRGDESPRLVPLTILSRAKYGNTTHWCSGRFVNYRVFSTSAKITSN